MGPTCLVLPFTFLDTCFESAADVAAAAETAAATTVAAGDEKVE